MTPSAAAPPGGVVPRMGFGTWLRTGDEALACIASAAEAGYRAFDTAERYGNEVEVGRGIAATGLARDEVFVTSKVWWDHLAPQAMRDAIRGSLDRLGMDRLDLYLIHWPSPGGEVAVESYIETLLQLQDEGLATHVGISNHTLALIGRARDAAAGRPLATNQVELHPFLQNRRIAAACHAASIPLTAYLPLARGRVAQDPELAAIAAELGATPAQVSLAFLMAEGHAVIPSSSKPARIVENFGATRLALSPAQIDRLRGLDRGARFTDPGFAPAWD
ncbi:aldo/keto reductase [Frigidibacter sp. MR17.24]|uniref:aldo/keto reductase n=1 Tax=Frigidibacter sp. MR17.24 TaxID=3127345 RepID=UPI003012FB73